MQWFLLLCYYIIGIRSAKNRKVNAKVSSSALSTAEREQINDFVVVAGEVENRSRSRCNKSVWRYFGALHPSANG